MGLRVRLEYDFLPEEDVALAFEWIEDAEVAWTEVGELRDLQLLKDEPTEEEKAEQAGKKGKKDTKKKKEEVEWIPEQVYEGYFEKEFEEVTINDVSTYYLFK